jgi:hypothetical protein
MATMAHGTRSFKLAVAVVLLGGIFLVAGCDEDECINCIEQVPIAPAQVFSVSGDEMITIYWDDLPEAYNTIDHYRVYSRFYEVGDEDNPDREFFEIGRVNAGTNFDPDDGQYHFVDQGDDVENGLDYEYSVSAVSRAGLESYRTHQFRPLIDTPLPMSEVPIEVFDAGGSQAALSGFDFSLAAEGQDGRVDPGPLQTSADVRVAFREGVPYLEAVRADVHLQDYGTFTDGNGNLYFEGVSWAPEFGYSASGVLELIEGHVYVLEIVNEVNPGTLHYAKLGVAQIRSSTQSVRIMWAYQLVDGLPELSVPEAREDEQVEFVPIKL